MRKLVAFALLAVLAPFAAAQEKGPALQGLEPGGTVLLEALPERTDLVVHTADLPALLASATPAGLGAADAWQRSFAEQLRRWGGTGDAGRFERGGTALLALADGEAVLAGMTLPTRRGPTRTWLFALRTRAPARRLADAVRLLVDGGLKRRYPGPVRTEEIQGRPVLALHGVGRELYLYVDDGVLVAADHPLALGLLLKGLERAVAAGGGVGRRGRLLEVRHGHGDTRWTAWTEGGVERVHPPGAVPEAAPDDASLGVVLAVPFGAGASHPLLPERLPPWARAVSGFLPRSSGATRGMLARLAGGELVVVLAAALPKSDRERVVTAARAFEPQSRLAARGTERMILGPRPVPPAEAEPVVGFGSALRGGWLRAMSAGAWPLPVNGVARTLLPELPQTAAAERLAWSRDELFLAGPAWHGPATFLALRTVYDVCNGLDPDDVTGPTAVAETDPGTRAPLPPPAAPRPVRPRQVPPGPVEDE